MNSAAHTLAGNAQQAGAPQADPGPAPLTREQLRRALQAARDVRADASFSDVPSNGPRYAPFVGSGLITAQAEDRGDGIARIRIHPTALGEAFRDSPQHED